MKKSHIVVSAVGVCLLLGSVAIQPYGVMKEVEDAIASKDKDALAELVDFPALKKNIVAELNDHAIQESKGELTPEATEFIKEFANDFVAKDLTAETIIKFAEQQKQAVGGASPAYGYEAISRFSATFHPATGQPIEFVVERSGLSWRLTNIRGFLDHYVPFPDANDGALEESKPEDAKQEDSAAEASERLSQSSVKFELQKVSANIWTVLSGGHTCINELSAHPTCIETGESLYPASGSKFLDVTLGVRNQSEISGTLGPADTLIARYRGRDYRYSAIADQKANIVQVQPLAEGEIHAYFEVPESVLNDAEFLLSVSGSEIPFSFETPAQNDAKLAARREEERQKEDVQRKQDAADEAQHKKCWALNDKEAPTVTREEYGWYVENCSHIFLVQDYEFYLRARGEKE